MTFDFRPLREGDLPLLCEWLNRPHVAARVGGGWWSEEHDEGVVGIDQFLANPGDLGQGLGTEMVRQFVQRLFADSAVTRIQTDPAPNNRRAIRSYEKVGFGRVEEIRTPDGPALLMAIDRT